MAVAPFKGMQQPIAEASRSRIGECWVYFSTPLRAHPCHLTAGLSASATCFRALHHHLIIPKTLAVQGTLFADVCTHLTDLRVRVRHAQHEVGTGLTDFGTVHQQGDVTGF